MHITSATAYHLKAPLETPYRTTFGVMTHRQAVIVILTGSDDVTGIGETYINFPTWAPFERLATYREALFGRIAGVEIEDIPAFMGGLWRSYMRAAMQGGCLGPLMQALSAVSCALWDLRAKREGVPLRALFSDSPAAKVKVYGSGINPPFPGEAIRDGLDMGMDVMKLKLGFGTEQDRENIRALKLIVGNSASVAVDVNRSWSFEETCGWLDWLADNGIAWLEEPLDMADQHRYPELLERSPVPVSAGENFLIPPGTDFTVEGRDCLSFNGSALAPDIIQPAVVKNCCFGDAVRFTAHVEGMGKKVFPHFLGSAPGMATSANLAALTADPHLEWDINPNPLRTSFFTGPLRAVDGMLTLPDAPGIGWDLDMEALERWTVSRVAVP